MEITKQKKLSQHIFRLLKVTEITYPIGRTSKGNLGIRFTQNSEDFDIMLDSIPLTTNDVLRDDNNIDLKKVLEKYLFDEPQKINTFSVGEIIKLADTGALPITEELEVQVGNKDNQFVEMVETNRTTINLSNINEMQNIKKRGRPAGAKNKAKE